MTIIAKRITLALTTGTMELAAGETVSGSSRLVEGVVNLLLLAFGIVAAAAMVNLPDAKLVDRPVTVLGWAAPVLGCAAVAVAVLLMLVGCTPRSYGDIAPAATPIPTRRWRLRRGGTRRPSSRHNLRTRLC